MKNQALEWTVATDCLLTSQCWNDSGQFLVVPGGSLLNRAPCAPSHLHASPIINTRLRALPIINMRLRALCTLSDCNWTRTHNHTLCVFVLSGVVLLRLKGKVHFVCLLQLTIYLSFFFLSFNLSHWLHHYLYKYFATSYRQGRRTRERI